ncbi:GNAT family N-acetyltransferase [Nocardioides alcanivorans]|uniref:GNAT family N-acetyltransferase n=1 Tax=Nocardioides alcanivorans TaxID=2897352 RepID=UPI001F47D687|nr:GNAT family N-acetyltransferase [Nocardioides alcanivorans]
MLRSDLKEMAVAEISVVDAAEQGRFEVHVDGALVGFTEYSDRDGIRTFPHTEVDEAYAGQGLAKRVIRDGLDATRAAGLQVRPVCPAVAGFIKKNPDYADLVPDQFKDSIS